MCAYLYWEISIGLLGEFNRERTFIRAIEYSNEIKVKGSEMY